MAKKILKVVGLILLAIIMFAACFIGYLTLTEYNPDDVEKADVTNNAAGTVEQGDSFKIMTWNIGYSALGDDADFFMDGGKNVRSSDKARVEENISDIVSQLEKQDLDVAFLQEVDRNSARSYGINQEEEIANGMPAHGHSFANNFKVKFIPYPMPPIGKVDSGLLSLSMYKVKSASRISLPCSFKWPVRMANLKRCLLVQRVPVEGSDKELVLVNLHLEAYDSGEGKIAQTKALRSFLDKELAKGNYVIAGGDFNQSFDDAAKPYPQQEGLWTPGIIKSSEFSKDFSLKMDNKVPTSRLLIRPFDADDENFPFYMLDGFIVSNNLKVKSLETLDLHFKSSDHNPVLMEVELK